MNAATPTQRWWVTQRDAAAILGVSTDTVRRMVRKGQLPVVLMNRREVIRRDDLDAFITGTRPTDAS
jgi:excisionase family DNA binding protein